MKKIKDPFGFSKAINYEKLNDPKVLETLSNMFDNKKETIDFKDLKKNDRIKSNQIGVPITGKLMESPKQGKGLKKIVLIWTNGSEVGMFDEHGSIYANQITEVERDGTWHEVNHG